MKGELIKAYWKPVYCYLRGKGQTNEAAKDLTQGFFQDVVLEGDLVERADAQKGRFRWFLLAALDQYVQRQNRRKTAKKRTPTGPLLSLDTIDSYDMKAVQGLTPEQAFAYAWASDLLAQVLEQLKGEYQAAGREVHWQVFLQTVVEPILQGSQRPALVDLCRRYCIDRESQVSNMILTVKRRFRSLLAQTIRNTADPAVDADDEIAQLIEILSLGRAGY